MGISFDPSDVGTCNSITNDLYDSLTDNSKSVVNNIVSNYSDNISRYIKFNKDILSTVFNEIKSWFSSNSSVSSGVITVTPNESGKIGFASDQIFSFYAPAPADNDFIVVDLGQSFLYYGYVNRSVWSPYSDAVVKKTGSSSSATREGFVQLSILQSDNVDLSCVSITNPFDTLKFAEGTYTANLPTLYGGLFKKHNSCYIGFQCSASGNRATMLNRVINDKSLFYDSDGFSYELMQDGTKWSFCRVGNQTIHYHDLEFDDYYLAVGWFLLMCGLGARLSSSSSITPSVSDDYQPHANNTFVFDTDIVNNYITNVYNTADEDDDVTLVVIGNDHDLNEVINNNLQDLMPGDGLKYWIPLLPDSFPLIVYNRLLWETKFPFCLFSDFANLLSIFEDSAEIPEFNFLLFPDGFFGMDFGDPGISSNDDIYITVDFAPYDSIVRILRFFISAGFIAGLILITSKFTKSG